MVDECRRDSSRDDMSGCERTSGETTHGERTSGETTHEEHSKPMAVMPAELVHEERTASRWRSGQLS